MPVNDDPPTRRDFDRLERAVDGLIRKVDDLPDKISDKYVEQKVYLVERQNDRDDIDKLTKIVNAVIAFVCTGVGAAILGVVLGGR